MSGLDRELGFGLGLGRPSLRLEGCHVIFLRGVSVGEQESICTGKGVETKSRSSFETKYGTVQYVRAGLESSGVMGRCAARLVEVISLWWGGRAGQE